MDARNVAQSLEEHFGFLQGALKVTRPSRIFTEVPQEACGDIVAFAADTLGFTALSAITGSEEPDGLSVMYHLNREGGIVLSIKVKLPKDRPVVQTVTARFPCADVFERELVDLLGIAVEGLPPGNRYPLPDTWPADEHPLRKDWKPKEAPHA